MRKYFVEMWRENGRLEKMLDSCTFPWPDVADAGGRPLMKSFEAMQVMSDRNLDIRLAPLKRRISA